MNNRVKELRIKKRFVARGTSKYGKFIKIYNY